jgi:hypothetical protein
MIDLTSEGLVALEDIKRLKARYCRYIDTKQWQALQSLFTADVRFDGFASAPTGSDAATFIQGVSARLGPAVTMHHCHTPDIVLIDPDRARAVWAMSDYMEWPQPIDLPDAPGSRGLYGFGHYEEEYRREEGAWRIAHLRLRRMRLIPLPADHPGQTTPTSVAGLDWLPGGQ